MGLAQLNPADAKHLTHVQHNFNYVVTRYGMWRFGFSPLATDHTAKTQLATEYTTKTGLTTDHYNV